MSLYDDMLIQAVDRMPEKPIPAKSGSKPKLTVQSFFGGDEVPPFTDFSGQRLFVMLEVIEPKTKHPARDMGLLIAPATEFMLKQANSGGIYAAIGGASYMDIEVGLLLSRVTKATDHSKVIARAEEEGFDLLAEYVKNSGSSANRYGCALLTFPSALVKDRDKFNRFFPGVFDD